MPIYSLDLDRAPATISSRHIKGIPTLLLMRENRVEARADGADLEDLLRLMEAAKPYLKGARQDDEDASKVSPMNALKSAEQMLTESSCLSHVGGRMEVKKRQQWLQELKNSRMRFSIPISFTIFHSFSMNHCKTRYTHSPNVA
ncbi:unnamed protein product [Durusdinium trenchii]|uniref:Thioredoxin domain-containing protein n=1 Tax=Durusdinium trenchii TaxID=1381693 RepID=A0ABP0LYX9_9DINO